MRHPKDQKVVVAYPYGHEVSARFHHSMVFLLTHDAKKSRRIIDGGGFLGNSSGANVTNARNEIVRAFLEKLDADWLLFVDTDMTFDPDLVDRMVKAAHPEKRPILGALCFSLQRGDVAAPTLYTFREDGLVGRMLDYPRGKVVQVGATGTGCLLIHRKVLEAVRDRGFSDAYPWFQETQVGSLPVGEDITFCIRAGALGFPVFVDTSIEVGHEKPFVVGESMFAAQSASSTPADPTFVVIPKVAGERDEWTAALVERLSGDATAVWVDDSDAPIHRKWNAGLDAAEGWARAQGHRRWNVAILNNDLEVGDGFLGRLAEGLRRSDDFWVSYPDVHGAGLADGDVVATSSDKLAGQTLSGFAFMVRGEARLRFDEQFEWWYGDSDLERQVRAADKQVVTVGGCKVRHLEPMRSTASSPDRLAMARRDEARFAEKWGVDPSKLWLAQHPEFAA